MGRTLWTVEGVLSAAECQALIHRIEAAGPEPAPISTRAGARMDLEVRNNLRVMFDDAPFAALLFERARPHLPVTLEGMDLVGANERLRCYRYDPGHRFAPHTDGAFIRDARERSLLTFIVYLNEGFMGGATAFPHLQRAVVPRTGLGLLFQHRLLHEGCPVESGVKYALRTDILYRAQ